MVKVEFLTSLHGKAYAKYVSDKKDKTYVEVENVQEVSPSDERVEYMNFEIGLRKFVEGRAEGESKEECEARHSNRRKDVRAKVIAALNAAGYTHVFNHDATYNDCYDRLRGWGYVTEGLMIPMIRVIDENKKKTVMVYGNGKWMLQKELVADVKQIAKKALGEAIQFSKNPFAEFRTLEEVKANTGRRTTRM